MGSQQRTQTHPGISHDVPHTRTRGISPLKDVSMSKCTVAQYLHLRRTALCWVGLCIKWEVCIRVEFIVMLIDKVFSWTALGLESVHSLEARCSHVVIIIPWLFGKTGLASGTFIYRHGKTRKDVCWHSKWKQNKQTKCLQLEENQEKNAAEYFSDADGLFPLSHWQHWGRCLTLSALCFRSTAGEEPKDWEI